MAAHNERFCESGGVARPTLCVEQPLPLSSKSRLYPRPRKAAFSLSASGGQRSGQLQKVIDNGHKTKKME